MFEDVTVSALGQDSGVAQVDGTENIMEVRLLYRKGREALRCLKHAARLPAN